MLRARGTHFQIPQLVTMSNNLTHAAMDSCLISSFLGLISMGCPPLPTPRQMRHISDPPTFTAEASAKTLYVVAVSWKQRNTVLDKLKNIVYSGVPRDQLVSSRSVPENV